MSVKTETLMKAQMLGEAIWDTSYSVRITTELGTVTTVNRILSGSGKLADYAAMALASAVFHFRVGWVRVDGGWVSWNHTEEGDRIQLVFFNDSRKE